MIWFGHSKKANKINNKSMENEKNGKQNKRLARCEWNEEIRIYLNQMELDWNMSEKWPEIEKCGERRLWKVEIRNWNHNTDHIL